MAMYMHEQIVTEDSRHSLRQDFMTFRQLRTPKLKIFLEDKVPKFRNISIWRNRD
jgi:hypothetical protein